MWRATTDEEANFIFDLLAEREDRKLLLEYSEWLQEHGRPRSAEFLRLADSPQVNMDRLKALRPVLDRRWLNTVTSRWFRVGDLVRITTGMFEGIEGEVRQVDAQRGSVGLLLIIICRQTELVWVDFMDLRLLKRTRWESTED